MNGMQLVEHSPSLRPYVSIRFGSYGEFIYMNFYINLYCLASKGRARFRYSQCIELLESPKYEP